MTAPRGADLLNKRSLLSARAMSAWANVALILIAVNAVLIQTIVTEDSPLKTIVRVAVLGITIVVLTLHRTVIPIWLFYFASASGILMALTLNTDHLSLIFVLLLVPALWSAPERSLDAAAARASVLSLALVFVLLFAGITTNTILVSSTEFVTDRERFTFGTNGVPFFMNIAYGAAALAIFYSFKWQLRSRWVVAIAGVGLTYYFFTQTNGRGGFLALLLFCALAVVMPFLAKLTLFRLILAAQPVLYLGAALWIAGQRNNLQLNEFLSYRPRLYGDFMATIQPREIVLSTTVKQTDVVATVDNSYLHLLVGGGIILFAIFSVVFASSMMKMSRRGLYLELAFVASAMAYAMSESILLRIENIFIIYTWYLILRHAVSNDRPRATSWETTSSTSLPALPAAR